MYTRPMLGARAGAAAIAMSSLALLSSGTARAQGDDAAELKKSGNEKMVDSDFAGALADYERALAITPDDLGLQYNAGRAHGFLGQHPEALRALETFDQRATPEQKARIAKFSELLADTRQHVGYLSVRCAVPDARLQRGAQILGPVPAARIPVEAGPAILRISAEGYLDDVRNVSIAGTNELSIDCRLLRKSTSGTFVVTATPPGALISIDGHFLGNTHVEVPLPAGPHRLLATRDGYESTSMPIVVTVGNVNRLDVPLQQKSVPITARWWFWTGIGVVVVGGVAITAAVLSERSPDKGSIPPQQLGAPLRF